MITDRVAVILDAQTWGVVLRIMAREPVPYETAAPLIAEIQRQCADHGPDIMNQGRSDRP